MFDWLFKPLRQFRALLLARTGVEALALFLAVLGGSVALLSWLASGRLALIAWAALLGVAVERARRLYHGILSDREAARALEQAFPELDSSLINAVAFVPELVAAPERGGYQHLNKQGMPRAMARRELERARERLAGVRVLHALSWRRAAQLGGIAAGILIVNALIGWLAPERYAGAWQLMATPVAHLETAWNTIRPGGEKEPRQMLADIAVEVRYPAYTGLAPLKVLGGDGTVTAMPGSQVGISARSLESIDEARLELFDPNAPTGEDSNPVLVLPATVSGSRVVSAEFTVSTAGRYRFLLDDEPSRFYPVEITPDEYPAVSMPTPAGDEEVRPDDRIAVLWEASDDFGLSKVELVAELGAGSAERRVLFEPEDPAPVRGSEHLLDLSALDLAHIEQVTLYVEATDNDTVNGPKSARSGQVVLQLRSAEKYHEQLLDDQERLLYGMVDWLADNLEPFPLNKSAGTETLVSSYADVDTSSRKVTEAFPQVLARMRDDELADYNVYVALENISRDVNGMRSALIEFGRRYELDPTGYAGPVSALTGPLSSLAASHEDPLERHIHYIDKLLYKQRIDDALRSEEDILEARDRLQELIEEYKKTQDPELKQKILEEMKALQKQIADAMNRLQRLYAEMPDEFINPRVQEGLEGKDLDKLSERLSRAFESGDLEAALGDFESFLEQVDQMMQGLRRSAGQFAEASFLEDLAAIQEAEAEAAKLEREQERLLEQTRRIQERAQPEEAAERAQKLLEEMRRHVDEAGKKLNEGRVVEFERLRSRQEKLLSEEAQRDPARRRQLEEKLRELRQNQLPGQYSSLERRTEELQKELDRLDYQAAEAGLMSTLGRLEHLAEQLDRSMSETPESLRQSEPDSRPQLERARQELIEALKKLHQARKAQQPNLSEADRQELKQLSERQRRLQKRTRQLGEQLDQLGKGSPMVDQNAGQPARQASGEMGEAGERLGQGQPSAAVPNEAGAKAHLGRLRENLSEMRQRMEQATSGGGMPMPMGMRGGRGFGRHGVDGVANPQAEVEVPDPGDYQVPPEFREEILKSMKEPGPAEYEPLNEQYYRKLIR